MSYCHNENEWEKIGHFVAWWNVVIVYCIWGLEGYRRYTCWMSLKDTIAVILWFSANTSDFPVNDNQVIQNRRVICSLVMKDLVYKAKAKVKNFSSRPRSEVSRVRPRPRPNMSMLRSRPRLSWGVLEDSPRIEDSKTDNICRILCSICSVVLLVTIIIHSVTWSTCDSLSCCNFIDRKYTHDISTYVEFCSTGKVITAYPIMWYPSKQVEILSVCTTSSCIRKTYMYLYGSSILVSIWQL